MADEKNGPPKAADGAQKPATEGGGPGSQVPAQSTAPPKATPPAGAGGGAPATPAKPPAATPTKPPAASAKPAAPAAKAPVKPEPWASPLLDELQKKFPGAISEAVIFRGQPALNVAKEHLIAVCQFLQSR